MKISMLVTADYASVEPLTNKLNILGVFRNIAAHSFPVKHRRMYLVAKVTGEVQKNIDTNKLSILITNDGGDEIARIESSFQLSDSPTDIPSEHNALFELNGIEFKEPGAYYFKVSVNDGETEETAVVQVLQREA